VAITDEIGGEAISKRIREQLEEHIQQAGLTLSTSYHSLKPSKRNSNESTGESLEKLAISIQELMNQELLLRRAGNGQ
jgi:hypothetical protein